MNKFDLLRNLIEDKNFQSDDEDFKYIGTGNPEAKILIIGKECSIHEDAEDQKRMEITDNFEFWKNFVSGAKDKNQNGYSPLYPYRGQKLVIRNSRTGDNGGTSLTWCKYQKLVNLIFDTPGNRSIDFHEKVFITEVNSSPSLKTRDANISSISFRKETILQSEFIRSFPVMIISGYGYFKTRGENEIEKIFEVKCVGEKIGGVNKTQNYWVHENEEKSKLLINTRQLSIGVSDALLEAVAKEIRESGLI